jgi:AcrR family transcriptional regulator
VDAAFRFLWSRPFREMTINSLMASTPVGRSAFYQYFGDVHELMETLLTSLGDEIVAGATPWLEGDGDPVALLDESLASLVEICHRRGPFIGAISDAATTDSRLEKAWAGFLRRFDDVVAARIGADQAAGLIPAFDPGPLAAALTRMDAYTFVHAFGRHPRSDPQAVRDAITRVWLSSLYGGKWVDLRRSDLVREPAGPKA